MPYVPTIAEYRLLLDAFTEVPKSERRNHLEPFKKLFEVGGGYEIFLKEEVEPVPCQITDIKWHGHAEDFTAFSAMISVSGKTIFVEFGELLGTITRTRPDHSVYYGPRIRTVDTKALAA